MSGILPHNSSGQSRIVLEEPNVMSEIPNYNRDVYRVGERIQEWCKTSKCNLLRIYGTYKRTTLVCFNSLIIVLGLCTLTNEWSCDTDSTSIVTSNGDKLICDPFSPSKNVIVDFEQNSSLHCYSSASCVSLAQNLRNQQGYYRYNFIIGIYGFVFVERGFKCQTQEEHPGLYILIPVDSIYLGTDFMISNNAIKKFTEILREGLMCGKIPPDFTMTATGCGDEDPECSDMLDAVFFGDRRMGPKKTQYYDHTQEGSLYDPFDFNRVYNHHSILVACAKNMSK